MLNEFLQTSPIPVDQLIGTYDIKLIALSYLAALFSSYIALDITGYLREPHNTRLTTVLWITCGGLAMGAGIWSMHFIGMLAFSLPGMSVHYDFFWTSLSLLVAILACAFALILLKIPHLSFLRLLLGGVILGLAIATMHYMGMEGMKAEVEIRYIPYIFIISIIIAIAASEAALLLALKSNDPNTKNKLLLKIVSALIMAFAICGMHYTGMAAAIFTPKPMHEMNVLSTYNVLALSIVGVIFLITVVALFGFAYRQVIHQKMKEYIRVANLLQNILDSSIEYSIIAIDLQGTILTWNAGARNNYGYEESEMVAKENVRKLCAPADVSSGKIDDLFNKASKKGQAEATMNRIRKDGTHFLANIVVNIRRDLEGQPIGYLIISKDITEQKRLDEQLRINQILEERNSQIEESNRLKNEFLANMSHELRTPLNAIIGFSELIYDEELGTITDKQKLGLADIITSARHLLKIINDLLDMAKVESGRMSFVPQESNLKKLLEEVIETLSILYQKKRINLTTTLDNSIENVYLDPSRLKQIFYNLLSNAIKFTPDLGSIHLRVSREGADQFRFEVEDNGIGIKPDDLPKIFTKFFQLDSSVSRKFSGTGLGLSLTKQLVEAQGGTIGVVSTLGKGSIFYVILPIAYQAPQKARIEFLPEVEKEVLMPSSKNQAGMHHALVIEDNPMDLNSILSTLRDNGFIVKAAETGKSAIEQANSYHFDIITLDLLLPDMNGFEVLRAVRHGLNKNTPVIVVTVCPKENEWSAFLINEYMLKPLEKEKFIATINKFCLPQKEEKKIVIVEDDLQSAKLMKQVLEIKGYNIICVPNVDLALKTVEAEKPDLIILDLILPELDGFDFLRYFSQNEDINKIPIVVWTAKDLTQHENDILMKYTQAIVLKCIGESVKNVLIEVEKILAANKKLGE